MKEPTRWIEADGSTPRLRELFQSAHPTRAMTSTERARSAAAVARIAGTSAAVSPMFMRRKPVAALLLARGAAALFVVGGVLIALSPGRSASPTPVAEVLSPITTASAAMTEQALPMASTMSAPPASPQARTSLAGTATALTRETALLDQARHLLRTDPSAALDLLEKHARANPNGRFYIERECLTIEAMIRLGRTSSARVRAQALRARTEGSADEGRVQQELGRLFRKPTIPYD